MFPINTRPPVPQPPVDRTAQRGASAAAANLSEASNPAKSAESPKSGALGKLSGALRQVFTKASNPSAKGDAEISSPTNGKAVAATLHADPKDLKELGIQLAAGQFRKASDGLTPLLYKNGPTLADSQDLNRAFLSLTSGLRTLQANVVTDAGPNLRLVNVSDTLASQIRALLDMPIAHGPTSIWNRVEGGENVLANPETLQQLMRYTDDAKNTINAFVQETGDTAVAAKVKNMFQDPLAQKLLDKLGTTEHKQGLFQELSKNKDFARLPNDKPGIRYKDIPVNLTTATQLKDGSTYFAHKMLTSSGDEIGTAMNYPKPADLPAYMKLIIQEKPQRLVVLASEQEVKNNNLPAYFSTDKAKYGDSTVRTVATERMQFGILTVQKYDMTVRSSSGETKVPVYHVLNWPDKTSVPAETLMALSSHFQDNGGMDGTFAHCKAGVGRTGALLATNAMMEYGISAEQAIVAMRKDRSPFMVQTSSQLETVVKVQRELELQRAIDQAKPAATSRTAVYANRVSLFVADPGAVDDGEPIYQNVSPAQQRGHYENWSPAWAGATR